MLEKFRILIVDDDALVLELMKHAARRHDDLKIESTNDARQAIEMIRDNKPYHIVLSDLVMPKFSGLDVLRAARMRSPDSRGIIVTGFGDKKSTIEAIKLGVSDYLHKPFRIEELDLAIRNAIEHFHKLSAMTEISREVESLKSVVNEKAERIESLETQIAEIQKQVDKERSRRQGVPEPMTKGRISVSQTLSDLGKLYRANQISDKEFQSMRKSIIDKAYKSII